MCASPRCCAFALALAMASWLSYAAFGFAQSVPEALDTPTSSIVWTTGGNAAWSGQTSTSHDGVDAVRSGAIGNNQTSYLQATVPAAGVLRYWRKISTELDWDYLRVYRNGVEVLGTAISGEVDWQRHEVVVNAANDTVRWAYSKDELDEGTWAHAVWLDEVTLTPADSGAPFVTRQPQKTGAEAGSVIVLEAAAFGQPPLSYQWFRDNVAIAGETAATLVITGFQVSKAGTYRCEISNALGSASTDNAALSVISHGAALDDTSRSWTAQGDLFWFPQSTITHDGIDALKSGPIGDNQRCTFSASFTGPGLLSYWRKLATEEEYDFLRVRVDGVVVQQASGNIDWELQSINLTPGIHEVSWSYEKNIRFTFPDDAVWIDQIRLTNDFATWRSQYFSTEELNDPLTSGPSADPNYNGLANLVEYALDLNPRSTGALLPPLRGRLAGLNTLDEAPWNFALELTRPASLPSDVTIIVQQCDSPSPTATWIDLARKVGNGAWVLSNGGLIDEEPSVGGRIRVIARAPGVIDEFTPNTFLRMRISVP